MTPSNEAPKAKSRLFWNILEFAGTALMFLGLAVVLAHHLPLAPEKLGSLLIAAGFFLGLFIKKVRDYYPT